MDKEDVIYSTYIKYLHTIEYYSTGIDYHKKEHSVICDNIMDLKGTMLSEKGRERQISYINYM